MRLWPDAISTRLAWLFALASVLVSGAIGAYLYQSLEREIAARDDAALIGRVDRMRALVDDSASIEALRSRPHLYGNMMGNRDSVLWMIDAQGRPIIEINPAQLPLPALGASSSIALANASAGQATRLAWVDVVQGGRQFTLVAGKMLAERDQILGSYRNTLLIALAAGAALSFLLGWLISERSLRPVRQLAARAAAIDASCLHVRLGAPETSVRELDVLSGALDQMLERLAGGFAQLSRFSEDLAHELRTPLSNLMGQTQHTLRKVRPVQHYEELLASNQEEYERLARMIDSILFLARSEQTDAAIDCEAIDLGVMAAQLIDYFEGMADERGIVFEVHASGVLHADRVLVRRTVANLMANALQHGPRNSKVMILGEVNDQGAAISVQNGGKAIDDEHLPHLFDRFYRCDPARSKASDCGGLGLAIVRSIMHLHKGSVSVTSVPNATCFTLRFPPPAS